MTRFDGWHVVIIFHSDSVHSSAMFLFRLPYVQITYSNIRFYHYFPHLSHNNFNFILTLVENWTRYRKFNGEYWRGFTIKRVQYSSSLVLVHYKLISTLHNNEVIVCFKIFHIISISSSPFILWNRSGFVLIKSVYGIPPQNKKKTIITD